MDIRASLDDRKKNFDIRKHFVVCCSGASKEKLVSTKNGMENLRRAAETRKDLVFLSRIQHENKFFYHVTNYACYKSYIRQSSLKPLGESNQNNENINIPSNSSRKRHRSLDNAFLAKEG